MSISRIFNRQLPRWFIHRCFVPIWLLGFALLAGSSFKAAAQPYGMDSRPTVGPFLNNIMPEAAPTVAGNWSAVPAFPNIYFTNAIGITFMPGTNRLCVWEREGRIWSFQNNSNATGKTLVLDISNQCQGWDDSGLLGMAFHPGFLTNHYMFVYYTWVVPGTVQGNANTRPPTFVTGAYHDRLSRFTLDANGVAIPGSEFVLIDQVGNSVWHNGGGMFFHPENGFLYLTDGDDAAGSNDQIITQNLFSSVLRIDVDMRGGSISHPIPRQPANGTTANYYIPNDNPFVGQPNVLEEFFCLGLRSPHRMTIDPPSGRIFIGDVGEGSREEIDIIEPGESGLNFQWNRIEGLNGDLTPPYIGINRRPVLDYSHSEGFAVIGGYVYRGSEFAAELGGKYIFGDNGSRTIWVMDESTVPAGKTALCVLPKGTGPNSGNDYTGLSSFGLDENNELYMCQMSSVGGRIYKLANSSSSSSSRPLPTLLSQTGAFTNLLTLAPASGLLPYNVNSPLWSDGAVKSRWIALPTNSFINFAPTGEWTFPAGTVFVKHFGLATNENFPGALRRLETRLLVRDTNGTIYGASYKWRPDYSDADLVPTAVSENVTITTTSGSRTQQWFYPGRDDCLRCHTAAAGGVLGVKTRQQNGDFTYPSSGITDNQIRTWNHIGMFSSAVSEPAIPGYTKLVSVTNTSASLEFRVRSYLDANCSHCHRPSGVPTFFDARIDTPLESQGLINGPVLNLLNIPGARVVFPADTNKSVLFQRDNSLGSIKMPPLAKNMIDSDAIAVIAQWIASLPPQTNAVTIQINFQAAGAPSIPAGYVADYGDAFGDRGNGYSYGWNIDNTANARYRNSANSPDLRYDTLNHMQKAGGATTWEIALPNGDYAVVLAAGDPDNVDSTYRIAVESNLFLEGQPAGATHFFQTNGVVTVSDGRLTVGNFAGAANNKICFIEITPLPKLPPTWLVSGTALSNGVFHVSLQGQNGTSYVIEATTNFTTWTPILTNTPTSNMLHVVDPSAADKPFRFYRAREK